ncbi:MAG TPA: YbaB/EbfC family nucleoid-associated protein [Stackebrandtia sp.]|uniref:YbaB/EbfC family nucleoid-associated protein n=1 Tax=Stackebrandtia sp. TaxID=2023065 RepID=UPI002D455729|nr:YbaB/EbfC family nucleoid-associated protein [Stackebrandtia sp.]HZE41086.1 YbaB/EbfC family nucleoid-associated protein [Stackebrandtia sp.]
MDPSFEHLDRHLREARVTATSPRSVVKVVYNGHGDGVGLEIAPGASARYGHETMAGFMTAALQAADRAVESLHRHLAGDARGPADRADAAATVRDCFGGGQG